jgi:hypothetical protein
MLSWEVWGSVMTLTLLYRRVSIEVEGILSAGEEVCQFSMGGDRSPENGAQAIFILRGADDNRHEGFNNVALPTHPP